jgi:hypothetical protein
MGASSRAPIVPLSDRDVRALTECMTTLEDVGMVAGAERMYTVISESGQCYTVDVSTGACDCADAFYRDPTDGCKHARRVEFATGRREIPEWVNREAVDGELGEHVTLISEPGGK